MLVPLEGSAPFLHLKPLELGLPSWKAGCGSCGLSSLLISKQSFNKIDFEQENNQDDYNPHLILNFKDKFFVFFSLFSKDMY